MEGKGNDGKVREMELNNEGVEAASWKGREEKGRK